MRAKNRKWLGQVGESGLCILQVPGHVQPFPCKERLSPEKPSLTLSLPYTTAYNPSYQPGNLVVRQATRSFSQIRSFAHFTAHLVPSCTLFTYENPISTRTSLKKKKALETMFAKTVVVVLATGVVSTGARAHSLITCPYILESWTGYLTLVILL